MIASIREQKKLVVVEGQTDQHVVLHLLKKLFPKIDTRKIPEHSDTITVELPGRRELLINLFDAGGIDSLCTEIGVRLKSTPNFSHIGFVFDADEDPADRWKRVRHEIVANHRTENKSQLEKVISEKPVPGGVWVADKEFRPTVGMWMMPDNKKPGAIEELLYDMIPQNDPRWGLAEGFVRAVTGLKMDSKMYGLSKSKVPKAKIFAWLAVQKEPGKRLGSAIGSKYFDTEACKAQPFLQWLGELRLEPSE